MFVRVLLSIDDNQPHLDMNIDTSEHSQLNFSDFIDNIVIEQTTLLQRTNSLSYFINDRPVSSLSYMRNIYDIFVDGDILEIVFNTRPMIHSHSDAVLAAMAEILRQSPRASEHEDLDVKVVLPEEEFSNVGIETKESSDDLCVVCQENLTKEEEQKILKCKHIFHKECIRKWLLEQSNKCPMCKIEVSDKKKYINMGEEREIMLHLPGGTDVEIGNPFAQRQRMEYEYAPTEPGTIFNVGTMFNFLD